LEDIDANKGSRKEGELGNLGKEGMGKFEKGEKAG
jgi:hypothetical protein